jgi:hypothetical protein
VTTKTLSEALVLNLRIDEVEYRIDLSDAKCPANYLAPLDYLPGDNTLP